MIYVFTGSPSGHAMGSSCVWYVMVTSALAFTRSSCISSVWSFQRWTFTWCFHKVRSRFYIRTFNFFFFLQGSSLEVHSVDSFLGHSDKCLHFQSFHCNSLPSSSCSRSRHWYVLLSCHMLTVSDVLYIWDDNLFLISIMFRYACCWSLWLHYLDL